mmetsp:Transcript_67696/g.180999  ORF Transcript_67696/g.180999 Transcript_67696/m.180999 type:complete len:259 (+) Transcript_67696:642-1418(+)
MSAASRSSSTTLPASSAPPPSPSLSSNPSSFSASCHARMHPLQTRPRPPGAKSKPSLWLHVAMASFHVRGSSSAAGGPGALRTRMGSALAPAGRRNQHTTCTAFHYRPGNANSAHTHQLFHAHAGLLSIQARTPLLRRPDECSGLCAAGAAHEVAVAVLRNPVSQNSAEARARTHASPLGRQAALGHTRLAQVALCLGPRPGRPSTCGHARRHRPRLNRRGRLLAKPRLRRRPAHATSRPSAPSVLTWNGLGFEAFIS